MLSANANASMADLSLPVHTPHGQGAIQSMLTISARFYMPGSARQQCHLNEQHNREKLQRTVVSRHALQRRPLELMPTTLPAWMALLTTALSSKQHYPPEVHSQYLRQGQQPLSGW